MSANRRAPTAEPCLVLLSKPTIPVVIPLVRAASSWEATHTGPRARAVAKANPSPFA